MTFFEYASYSRYHLEEDKRLWWHTASMMALQANINRDSKRHPQPYKAESFYPYDSIDKKAKFVRGMTEEERDLTSEWAHKFHDKHG